MPTEDMRLDFVCNGGLDDWYLSALSVGGAIRGFPLEPKLAGIWELLRGARAEVREVACIKPGKWLWTANAEFL